MPCYRCGTRQSDPEPGKPSAWHRGVAGEHQVLICPDCYPAVLPHLARCPRCEGARLVRRLDQVECLDCRLTRDAQHPSPSPSASPSGISDSKTESDIPDISVFTDNALAAEVAQALRRVLRAPLPAPRPLRGE